MKSDRWWWILEDDGDGDVIDGIYSEERRYEEKEGIRGESKT